MYPLSWPLVVVWSYPWVWRALRQAPRWGKYTETSAFSPETWTTWTNWYRCWCYWPSCHLGGHRASDQRCQGGRSRKLLLLALDCYLEPDVGLAWSVLWQTGHSYQIRRKHNTTEFGKIIKMENKINLNRVAKFLLVNNRNQSKDSETKFTNPLKPFTH